MENVVLYIDFEDEDDNVFNVVHNDDVNFSVDGNLQAVRDYLEEDSYEEQDASPTITPQNRKKSAGKKSETVPEGWNINYWTRNETLLVNKRQFIATSGCNFHIPDDADEYFFFKTFLTDEDIEYVTTETNRYATKFLAENEIPGSSSVWQWPKDGISTDNMWCFLALTLYGASEERFSERLLGH